MAFCGKCGQKIEDGVRFCPSCGAPLQANAAQPGNDEELAKATGTIDAIGSKLGNTADSTGEYTPQEIEQGKVMSILAYLGILVLVPIFAGKDSKYVRFHANQGVVLCLAWIGWGIADTILTAILRAILWRGLGLWSIYSLCGTVLNLVYLVFTILAIIGIINVLNGRAKDLPIIGKYRLLK